MKTPQVTQKRKNLVCNWCHKNWHIRADCWIHNKKQQDANVIELSERDEDKCDVLSITDSSVGNKDRWIIDSGCSQQISFDIKIVLLIHFMGNSATRKVISKETI